MRIGEALDLDGMTCDFEINTISVNHIILCKESEQGGYRYRISEPKTKADSVSYLCSKMKAALLREKGKKHDSALKTSLSDRYTIYLLKQQRKSLYTRGSI